MAAQAKQSSHVSMAARSNLNARGLWR